MIPSSLFGLALFVALLAPGLAYVLRHERVVPARAHSAFRETLRVVFVSITCLVVTGVIAAGIRWWLPKHTPNFRGLLLDPDGFAKGHHVQLIWWGLALLCFATGLGALAADSRVIELVRELRDNKVVKWVTGSNAINHTSAWHRVFEEYKVRKPGFMHVGAQLDDGTYVEGRLFSWNVAADEDENREFILHTPLHLTTKDGERHAYGASFTVISARHLVRLDVTRVDPGPVPSPREIEQTQVAAIPIPAAADPHAVYAEE